MKMWCHIHIWMWYVISHRTFCHASYGVIYSVLYSHSNCWQIIDISRVVDKGAVDITLYRGVLIHEYVYVYIYVVDNPVNFSRYPLYARQATTQIQLSSPICERDTKITLCRTYWHKFVFSFMNNWMFQWMILGAKILQKTFLLIIISRCCCENLKF